MSFAARSVPVFAPLSVSINAGESIIDSPDNYIFIGNTAVVAGGVAPFSYLWEWVSTFGTATWLVDGAFSATCTPKVENAPAFDTVTATLQVTVTDAVGAQAVASSNYSYARF